MRRVVTPGIRPRTRIPTCASGVSTTIGRPASVASTIRRAARSASIDSRGSAAPGANHAYSASGSPVKVARSCEPVRMSPGTIVVAVIPVPERDAARPSEKPTAPNFAVAYGSRCGGETIPPIDVTVPIRPRPRPRIAVSIAHVSAIGPVSIVAIASSKCSSVTDSSGPAWMIPATVMRTSIGPTVASTSSTSALTCARSRMSTTRAVTRSDGPTSGTALSSSPALRAAMTTWCPRSHSSRATRSPRPREAPTTRATGWVSASAGSMGPTLRACAAGGDPPAGVEIEPPRRP